MATVLLTGASGYLGSAIGAALSRNAVAYDTLPGRLEQLATHSLPAYQTVIHAAGAPRNRGPAAAEQTNRMGTQRLLAALTGDPRLLFISSRLVYGQQPRLTCTEGDPAQPTEFCGWSKLAAEQAIHGSGLRHVILRIPGLIGDSPAGLGHNFLADALRRFMSGGTVCRYTPDRLHDNLDVQAVADVCAHWVLNSSPLADGITNLTGQPRSLHGTLSEFAAVAAQLGGQPTIRDQLASDLPWPLMSDWRFQQNGGRMSARSDTEIATACCRALLANASSGQPQSPA